MEYKMMINEIVSPLYVNIAKLGTFYLF